MLRMWYPWQKVWLPGYFLDHLRSQARYNLFGSRSLIVSEDTGRMPGRSKQGFSDL